MQTMAMRGSGVIIHPCDSLLNKVLTSYSSSSSCYHCCRRGIFTNQSFRIKDYSKSTQKGCYFNLRRLKAPPLLDPSRSRRFSTTGRNLGEKRDFYQEEKLPIYDYGKIHSAKKRLYVFGQAAHGGLGLHTLMEVPSGEVDHRQYLYMKRPVRHTFAEHHEVRDIAAGHGFSLICVKSKTDKGPIVFGCGYNQKSQLGFQPDTKERPLILLKSIVPLALPLDKTSNVLAIAAGRAHSIISVAGKGLITLGDNGYGQCGRKVIEDEEYHGSKYICRIPPFGASHDYDVVQLISKFDLSICLTKMGTLYTFGCNDQGQLGRGKNVPKPWVPAVVEGDLKGVRVTKVATSGSSVMALSDKGEVFGWGSNDCGQVNPETLSNIYFEPKRIKVPRRVGKIIDVAIGGMFTLLLNEYGNLYVWGTGNCLGMGPKNAVIKTPTLMPPPLFGRNEFSPDTSVTKIEASLQYAAAANSIGDLYTWGLSDSGCLGLGPQPKYGKYQYFPLRVALGAPVHKFCLGVDHTLLISKGGY